MHQTIKNTSKTQTLLCYYVHVANRTEHRTAVTEKMSQRSQGKNYDDSLLSLLAFSFWGIH